jgi:phosphate transport system substrate-binding protein
MKPSQLDCHSIIPARATGRLAGLVLLGLLAAGCPANKPDVPRLPPPSEGKVTIRGSNTFGEELGPMLIAAFKKEHPQAEFDLESKATVYGFASLLAGKCDIAAASRPPLKEELELAKMREIELNDYVVGSYSVAVVVHAGNPVANLTRDQVREIFTGAIKNWRDVGGPDAEIRLFIRDPISGTHLGFKELALGNQAYASTAKMFTDYESIARAVAAEPAGIGYVSLELARGAGLKGVSVGGVEPSVAAVHAGNYPYARVVRLHTNKARESALTRAFVQFVTSEAGKEIVRQAGFAP